MGEAPESVSSRVHRLMDALTDGERRVARALLANYPASGLGTSHSLAATAGVSAPTVIRTAVKLGFDGFIGMQDQLRAEVSDSASSPVLRTLAQGTAHRHATPISQAMSARIRSIEETTNLVPASELAAAAQLIADCPSRVVVTGGFFSESVARVMAIQLSQVRSDVIFCAEPLRRDAGLILDARRRSVLVLFDLRRYEPAAHELAKQVKDVGGNVVLFTDRWMSPAAEAADVVLPVEVEAIPFDTFVGLMALVEIVVESVMARRGSSGLQRMKQWETHATGHTRTADAKHSPREKRNRKHPRRNNS